MSEQEDRSRSFVSAASASYASAEDVRSLRRTVEAQLRCIEAINRTNAAQNGINESYERQLRMLGREVMVLWFLVFAAIGAGLYELLR